MTTLQNIKARILEAHNEITDRQFERPAHGHEESQLKQASWALQNCMTELKEIEKSKPGPVFDRIFAGAEAGEDLRA